VVDQLADTDPPPLIIGAAHIKPGFVGTDMRAGNAENSTFWRCVEFSDCGRLVMI
jgi:hypothetical protein